MHPACSNKSFNQSQSYWMDRCKEILMSSVRCLTLRSPWRFGVFCLVILALIGTMIGTNVLAQTAPTTSTPTATLEDLAKSQNAFAQVAKNAAPAVVFIKVDKVMDRDVSMSSPF